MASSEDRRIRALRSYEILDTEPELAFDDLISVASLVCDTPMALVSLVDESRQWFKAKKGLTDSETHRDLAFCAHAILSPNSLMQVSDAKKDPRFKCNPLVTGEPNIAFYAGSPLVTASGEALGTLCVLDTKAKQLSAEQEAALIALSRQVVAQIEIRRTNMELRRRYDELSQFAYRVSHDLKAPLSSSRRLAELILLDAQDEQWAEATQNAERIARQMKKLEEFVEELLNLSRADLAEEEAAAVNIKALAQEIIDTQKERIEQSGATLIVDIDKDIFLHAPRVRLEQILDNLISNAIKYLDPSQQQPLVQVRCHKDNASVTLEIADNGVGIPEDQHEQVGKLFKRFHPELASGSGIGLAIVYKHVHAMNGDIDFKSDSSGTTFTLAFPADSIRQNQT